MGNPFGIMDINDPRVEVMLRKFYDEELSLHAIARDAALPPDGALSDDGVQAASGADPARPETDLGNALFDYAAKKIGLLELCEVAFIDAFSKGDRRPNAKDVLKFFEVTGMTIAQAAAAVLKLVALIPK